MLTELPTIIHISKDAYRMFSSMCQRTGHAGEEDSATKSKPRKDEREKPFSNLTQAFLVAAAIGVIRGHTVDLSQNQKGRSAKLAQFIRGEYLRRDKNYEYFKQLTKSKFEAKTEVDVVNVMIQLAEYGVNELYEEFQKTGNIDFIRLSKIGAATEEVV